MTKLNKIGTWDFRKWEGTKIMVGRNVPTIFSFES